MRFAIPVLGLAVSSHGYAANLRADPINYHRIIRNLAPGDTLVLAADLYEKGLRIHDLHGAPERPIIITGPEDGPPAVLLGRRGSNTISIKNASYVEIRNLELDGRGVFVDAVKAEGYADYAHHITLENLHIHNFARHQQSVGISTKSPAWDWVVRGNRIEGVGTGMYFGDSDGSAPFIGGLIEGNQVLNTIGYNLQIKHQRPRPALIDMPVEPRQTIIRRNLFVKEEGASVGPVARPNVLVGHLPLEGPGKDDEYVVYGNLFFQNPSEALFQGEGNIALYSNLFFNSHRNEFPAIAIQPHNDIPRRVRVFFNTVVSPGKGIQVLRRQDDCVDEQDLVGNAVFAGAPLHGGRQEQNLAYDYATAARLLTPPVADGAASGLAPVVGGFTGPAVDLDRLAGLPDYDRDYAGRARDPRSRGAYSAVPMP